MSAEAFPLEWPDGWPRTPESKRKSDNRFGGNVYGLTVARSFDQLISELTKLGGTEIVISSNIPLRRDGQPLSERARLGDPGVAAYFMFNKKPRAMPADRFVSVAGNMRSLTLAIKAMRQLEMHGGGVMIERAFTGFAALAPPDWKKPWREVFGVKPEWSGDIVKLFKEKAKHRHPDAGGNNNLMAELNVAFAEAKRELNLE